MRGGETGDDVGHGGVGTEVVGLKEGVEQSNSEERDCGKCGVGAADWEGEKDELEEGANGEPGGKGELVLKKE